MSGTAVGRPDTGGWAEGPPLPTLRRRGIAGGGMTTDGGWQAGATGVNLAGTTTVEEGAWAQPLAGRPQVARWVEAALSAVASTLFFHLLAALSCASSQSFHCPQFQVVQILHWLVLEKNMLILCRQDLHTVCRSYEA